MQRLMSMAVMVAAVAQAVALGGGCRTTPESGRGPRVTVSPAGNSASENRPTPAPNAGGHEGTSGSGAAAAAMTRPDRRSAPTSTNSASPTPRRPASDALKIDSARLAELRQVVPATLPESGDARDPAFTVRQFAQAVLDGDAKRLATSLHARSAIRTPTTPAEWSGWRVALGTFDGVAGWCAASLDPADVVALLEPAPGTASTAHETVLVHLRPQTEADGAVSWRVLGVQSVFDAEWLYPRSRWIVQGVDRRVRQPEFQGAEAPNLRLLETVPDVARQLADDAASGRTPSVEQRLMTADEWQSSWPAELNHGPAPSEWALLAQRLENACRGGTPWAGCVVLSQFQLANSPTLWVRALVVFGRPDDLRRVYWTEWRTVSGIFKLAEWRLIPPPRHINEWLK